MAFASFLPGLADILVDLYFPQSLTSQLLPNRQLPGILPLEWPFLLAVTRFNNTSHCKSHLAPYIGGALCMCYVLSTQSCSSPVPLTHCCIRSHQTQWPRTAESPISFHGLTLTQLRCSHSKSPIRLEINGGYGFLTQMTTVLWDLYRAPTYGFPMWL